MTLLAQAAEAGRIMRDDVRIVVAQFGRQDIFFHAGAVAYSALLAGVPFFLLLASALGYVLGAAPAASSDSVVRYLAQILPERTAESAAPIISGILIDVEAKRSALGLVGAPLFAWFSTRFFGTIRASLNSVFDIARGPGLVHGKLYDLLYVVAGAVLVTIYLALSAYLEFGHSVQTFFMAFGLQKDAISFVEFIMGQLIANAFLALLFMALYKFVPARRVPWESAIWGGVWGAALFEITRNVIFEFVTRVMNPASLYSGTLAAIVVVVFWAYYAAAVFLIGGVVARVHEVRDKRGRKGEGERGRESAQGSAARAVTS